MGAFGDMFPGRNLRREARDEDSDGEGHRIPDGPLDLDSGVVRLTPPREERSEDEG